MLSLLTRIAEGKTIAEVWATATGHFARLGFARVNYGFTLFRGPRSAVGDPDDALFLTTCDPAYAQFYFRNGFYSKTLILSFHPETAMVSLVPMVQVNLLF